MKVGDTFAVAIAGHPVANAAVTEIADGKATLVIPATQVVMAIRTELDPEAVAEPSGNQHVLLGQEGAPVEENTDGED